MPSAVVDLTELVPMTMQRLDRSPLFQRWMAGAFVWAISAQMIAELKQVTGRSRLARRIRLAARDALIDALLNRAVIVAPATEYPRCRDPKDDIVIATAVAARADFIVTADRDLYDDPALVTRLRDEWSIRVALPAEFLAALG